MIIQSLLDLDFYKLTMAQLAFLYFPHIPVKFAFTNRTQVALAKYISKKELEQELETIRSLQLTRQEAEYLQQLGFRENFIRFLVDLKLPAVKVWIQDNDYRIEVKDEWPRATLWETIILAVVNELYFRALLRQRSDLCQEKLLKEGRRRLERKIEILEQYPEIKIVEFGTRRRFNFAWQEEVVLELNQKAKENFLGTSNVHLAQKHKLQAFGTFAHEMDMVFSGIFRNDLKNSHRKMLEFWWNLYGEKLSVALTDTYGTNFFFQDFTREQALKWRGLRQDSGDPIEFGERVIQFYKGLDIDPREKVIIFSDGLDIDKIIQIYKHFCGSFRMIFGWGTNLTNDLGPKALSIVVKAVEANGFGTVKLSDNIAKAIGSPDDIALFKKVFTYKNNFYEECRY